MRGQALAGRRSDHMMQCVHAHAASHFSPFSKLPDFVQQQRLVARATPHIGKEQAATCTCCWCAHAAIEPGACIECFCRHAGESQLCALLRCAHEAFSSQASMLSGTINMLIGLHTYALALQQAQASPVLCCTLSMPSPPGHLFRDTLPRQGTAQHSRPTWPAGWPLRRSRLEGCGR